MYEFDFELKTIDWLKFQLSHSFSIIPLHIAFILVLLPTVLTSSQTLITKIITFCFFFTFMWIFTLAFTAIVLLLKKDYMFLTQKHIIINEHCILSETKYDKSQILWNNRTEITQRLGNVLIYVSPNFAILLPRRTFQSDGQRKNFIDFCQNAVKTSTLV